MKNIFFILFFMFIWVRNPAQTLPQGNNGIAKNYPVDAGISSAPGVIFADDFESYNSAANLPGKWDQSYHSQNTRIATEQGNFFSGKKALEFTIPATTVEVSNTLLKNVNPQREILFLRYYTKYNPGFNVLGSSHNGSTIASSYWTGPGSGPGIPADGYNKFLISFEAGRFDASVSNPGELNIYIYHPEQRTNYGDHFYPNGEVNPYTYLPYDFGPNFISRPKIVPKLNQWYCFEVMLKANTPGQRDGRIAMWVDGALIADFMNLRLRDTTALKIDQFSIDLHVNTNTTATTQKWYDNVVVATSYIGPMVASTSVADVPEETTISLRPNPVEQTLYVINNGNIHEANSISIFNLTGQLLFTRTLHEDVNDIDVSTLVDGLYLIEIKNSKGKLVRKKFIKQ